MKKQVKVVSIWLVMLLASFLVPLLVAMVSFLVPLLVALAGMPAANWIHNKILTNAEKKTAKKESESGGDPADYLGTLQHLKEQDA